MKQGDLAGIELAASGGDRYLAQTHEVINQPAALVDYNLYSTDLALREAVDVQGGEAAEASLLAFGAISSLSWTMVFVVLGLRARSPEGYNGISSLITTIMIFASGVFFPAERFPEMLQPFLGLLPLTALNSGLRMLMLDGASLLELGPQILVLLAWTVIPLLLPRRAMAWT